MFGESPTAAAAGWILHIRMTGKSIVHTIPLLVIPAQAGIDRERQRATFRERAARHTTSSPFCLSFSKIWHKMNEMRGRSDKKSP
jgi:hypothetical protein